MPWRRVKARQNAGRGLTESRNEKIGGNFGIARNQRGPECSLCETDGGSVVRAAPQKHNFQKRVLVCRYTKDFEYRRKDCS